MARVFVVEDNDGLRETVSSYLELDGHEVVAFARLAGVLEALAMQEPDLMVLDVMLPDGDGFLFARRTRAQRRVPIIFLTARTAESDRITGFEVGGDDYVVKPFSMKELMLRVKAVLARTTGQPRAAEPARAEMRWVLQASQKRGRVTASSLVLNDTEHRATVDDRPVELTGAEWKILRYLGTHPAMVVARERLLGACLDYIAEGSERTIDTHVKNIRAKLCNPGWIETVRGFGYRFAGAPSAGTAR